MTEGKSAIVFGEEKLTPEQEAEYRKKIENARNRGVNALKGNDPVRGDRSSMPDFKRLQALRDQKNAVSGLSDDGGVQPRPAGSPILSPQTEQQLKELKEIAEAQKNEPIPPEEPKSEKKEEKKEESPFDLLDFDDLRASEAERLLNNKKRREEIEARCAPMSFEDLLYKNEVQQRVPIIPGKFEPTFRSLTPEESLFVKRYIAREQNISDQYLLEKYNLCLLTCSLVAINDRMLPDHRNQAGEPDEKLFEAKLKIILKKSGYIVADMGINYVWFDLRVRKLITADGLKNG
jgi:hypothetical protein